MSEDEKGRGMGREDTGTHGGAKRLRARRHTAEQCLSREEAVLN